MNIFYFRDHCHPWTSVWILCGRCGGHLTLHRRPCKRWDDGNNRHLVSLCGCSSTMEECVQSSGLPTIDESLGSSVKYLVMLDFHTSRSDFLSRPLAWDTSMCRSNSLCFAKVQLHHTICEANLSQSLNPKQFWCRLSMAVCSAGIKLQTCLQSGTRRRTVNGAGPNPTQGPEVSGGDA
jgi:hypothetical protein